LANLAQEQSSREFYQRDYFANAVSLLASLFYFPRSLKLAEHCKNTKESSLQQAAVLLHLLRIFYTIIHIVLYL
jgi:hypothetical protein